VGHLLRTGNSSVGTNGLQQKQNISEPYCHFNAVSFEVVEVRTPGLIQRSLESNASRDDMTSFSEPIYPFSSNRFRRGMKGPLVRWILRFCIIAQQRKVLRGYLRLMRIIKNRELRMKMLFII
jgi:hypothetical protein